MYLVKAPYPYMRTEAPLLLPEYSVSTAAEQEEFSQRQAHRVNVLQAEKAEQLRRQSSDFWQPGGEAFTLWEIRYAQSAAVMKSEKYTPVKDPLIISMKGKASVPRLENAVGYHYQLSDFPILLPATEPRLQLMAPTEAIAPVTVVVMEENTELRVPKIRRRRTKVAA